MITIKNMPEYSLELVARNTNTEEKKIFEKIQESAVITYKTYAITVNGEQINEVNTQKEAESIIANLQSDLKEGVEFNLGIVEVYKNDEQTTISEELAFENLNGIKIAKTEAYEAEQARLEAERIAREEEERRQQEAARQAAAYASRIAAAPVSYGSGNISGISLTNPLRTSPLITSRFGEVSARRYSAHSGLDLATSLGTAIYPIATGTVVSSGWQGSYGNMIVIDHGDGIQSWYGHCNTLNAGVGETVETDRMIATVGSTGNSTGPHLHLEIRINGVAVNPQNYLY